MILLYLSALVFFTHTLVAQDEQSLSSNNKNSGALSLLVHAPAETGLSGKDGNDGKDGSQGERGISGFLGLRRKRCFQGKTGPAGSKGDIGPSGAPDPKGDAVENGLTRDAGLPGNPGAVDPLGVEGECCCTEIKELVEQVDALKKQIVDLQKTVTRNLEIELFPSGRKVGEKIFKTNGFENSFEEAQKSCNRVGAVVASPRNVAENGAVWQLVQRYNKVAFLGMTDIKEEGKFIYSTGEPLDYSNWNSGEPNNVDGKENCIEILHKGKWNDVPCQNPHLVICEF